MRRLKRWLSPILAAALLAGALGPGAPRAFAQALRSPVAGPKIPQAAGWTHALTQLSGRLELQPGTPAGAPQLTRILGHLRLELAVRPGSPGALALVERLAPEVRSDPLAFARRPAAEQARLVAAAASRLSAELGPLASAVVERARQGRLSSEDAAVARSLAGAWFYLEPEAGTAFREVVAGLESARPLARARSVARGLLRRPDAGALSAGRAAAGEVGYALGRAERIGLRKPDLDRPRARELVREVLAPAAVRALDESAGRLAERGIEPSSLWLSVLEGHQEAFGTAAAGRAASALREAGAWTDFVAAVSIHAATRLAEAGTDRARAALAGLGHATELRFAIPSWHPLSSSHASVADWLAAAYAEPGRRDEERYGRRIASLSRIPIRVTKDFPKLAATALLSLFAAASFMSPGAGAAAHLLQAASGLGLTLLGILFHEWAHARVARAFGLEVLAIAFTGRGGAAVIQSSFRVPKHEGWVAIAGPAATAVYVAASAALSVAVAGTPLAWLAPVLLVQALFHSLGFVLNMLPVLPGDGGRVLRAMLAAASGDHYAATRLASKVGVAVAIVIVLLTVPATLLWGPAAIAMAFIGYSLAPGARKYGKHPGTILLEETKTATER